MMGQLRVCKYCFRCFFLGRWFACAIYFFGRLLLWDVRGKFLWRFFAFPFLWGWRFKLRWVTICWCRFSFRRFVAWKQFCWSRGAGATEIAFVPGGSSKPTSPDQQSSMASLSSSADLQPPNESGFISRWGFIPKSRTADSHASPNTVLIFSSSVFNIIDFILDNADKDVETRACFIELLRKGRSHFGHFLALFSFLILSSKFSRHSEHARWLHRVEIFGDCTELLQNPQVRISTAFWSVVAKLSRGLKAVFDILKMERRF